LLVLFCLAFLGSLLVAENASAPDSLSRHPAATEQRMAQTAPGKDRGSQDCCETSRSRGCCAHGGQSGLPGTIGVAVAPDIATLTFPWLPEPSYASRTPTPELAPPRAASV
jgi:hypothetical protein